MAHSIRLKIVTVDDSVLIAERLQQMISAIEHVEFDGNAVNISSALKLIDEKKPDVAILDIHLKDEAQGKNGIDLLIKVRETHPEIVVMMLTNLSEPLYKKRCLQHGADYFFDKSNDFEKVPEAIQVIIEARK